MARFPVAPLDRGTRLITFSFVVVLAFLTGLTAAAAPNARWAGGVIAVAAAALLAGFGYAPAAFEAAPGTLRVQRRLFGSRTFVLGGAVGRMPRQFGLGGIRLWGSGGIWGHYGLYWRRDVGRYYAYVTDRTRLGACETADGRAVVVSPADPDGLVQSLKGGAR
jgi:hypothetical protein